MNCEFCSQEMCPLPRLGEWPTPRSYVRSTSDGGAAVQPPGLSYTAHWEALGSALRFLTPRSIPCTGPVWG